ncbi:PAB-dependent poly(A)-specific ribonuclease subunit PAN3 [Cryptococcus neoformans C23]|uniref:PAN2-PAN3 deadenylation complex subunit PAN3 n=1 Tax=Cryptococcus neoformans (strain H99 / ATCC 208821 / CBS 10515 / FGSC 9487) TaxID=235443 RepID=J9VXS7_CRYN9|nr:PAB-dependent poly(A)-specific ribonuclease subunit PAN3 [Cryptococcus neoformans var. grubii H99]AUB27411.1 PAB-dependent poly(A)-specific ribonuclease subunit PAN3 [Cryptococcus neoformans var. grubii]OWZ28368.1 PAB-dependent poly(A)-specific ribonuclease subunit PAN3 [Cryptococcus neoformans var. grubii AD2-60a]OWZ40315.1 PAB-dependent poly(A)-specific ribonuclease subunit PAN3 [Cryptococcus neoformans var. grubii C23]OXC82528.1 PAB-dependent poly(A)-specific ribonuclease subunit PAN3 [Cr|eukprot:XP_012052229.1 PAB-dependent poly(A)-specific ribonuclease subunit PAN3 [Cryptococcus neoformans var. grubii H99]
MLPPPKSAAVQIVRPPSPSSEKAKEKEKKHSPEKRETPQRICRNVMIYGYCKYQDQGCIYYHPPAGADPSTPQESSPATHAPTPLAGTPAREKPTLSIEHLAAPVFVPKGLDSSSPRVATPSAPTPSAPTPPVWPSLPSTGLLPRQDVHVSARPSHAQLSATASPMAYDDPSHIALSAAHAHAQAQALTHSMLDPHAHAPPVDQSMYLPPRQPLDYNLYAAPLPSIGGNPLYPAHPHAFFVNDDLRRSIQAKQEAVYVGANGASAPGLPQELGVYHSLVPLPLPAPTAQRLPTQSQPSKVYGLPSPVYRATSEVDGNTYCLRRVEGFKLVNQLAFASMDTWRRMRHPNIVGLKEAFTTKTFGDNSLIMVYDYHPLSTTLYDEYLSPNPPEPSPASLLAGNQPPKRRSSPPERILWSYVTQIANALKAIHSSGLAVRNLDASKILLTGKNRIRLNGCGVWDVLAFDNKTPVQAFQQEDLLSFGQLVISLTCDFFQPTLPLSLPLEHISRHYSSDLSNLILYLISKPAQGQVKSIDEVVKMMGPRILNELDAVQSYADVLENELGAEVENGRIVRLLTKLGFINERAEFELDPRWSDTGDRYILKLFRDYVFHSVGVDGKPILDLSHVLVCLNKLDAGLDERVMLVSRDDQSCLVVSYREIKHCIEAAFNELKNAGNNHRVHR